MSRIAALKARLDILDVARELGIELDRSLRARCPFHDDEKPSLQFSREKQICTCFSSNCQAGTMDVIDLVAKYKQMSTKEAIAFLEAEHPANQTTPTTPYAHTQTAKQSQTAFASDFAEMRKSFWKSKPARTYAQGRGLHLRKVEMGYNAFPRGKFSYLKGCLTFALRDRGGEVVGMYGRSIKERGEARHFYTRDRQGLYPGWPTMRKVVLTESVIDAATLMSLDVFGRSWEVLALYGTEGLTSEHVQALQKIEDLEEVVLMLDGDEAGRKATRKYQEYLQDLFPEVKIGDVHVPRDMDLNELAQGHEPALFVDLLESRTSYLYDDRKIAASAAPRTPVPANPTPVPENTPRSFGLDTSNPNRITYTTGTASYVIRGGLRRDLDSLKVSLVIEADGQRSRSKLDLYEDRQTERIAREAGEKLGLRADLVSHDLGRLTDLLEDYREEQMTTEDGPEIQTVELPEQTRQSCLGMMKQPDLLSEINALIGYSGVAGEEQNRLFLFVIASSYKMAEPLHALIQGSSGSGKTHLLAKVMALMPPEDQISLTRITESSLYNYGKYELSNKLIGIEDYDGLEEKAELAFRELQSKGMISSSTSGKVESSGRIESFVKVVHGPVASLAATTRGEVYEDNLSRCFLVAVDESREQTLRVIDYQNRKAAGQIDKKHELQARDFLRNCVRLLKPYEVVNPFANQIKLPEAAHKIRRLNELFQSYVRQITLIHQYQREVDAQGRLITAKADIEQAIEVMFEGIVLKVDELDGSLRSFYEKLKAWVGDLGKDYEFSRLELRGLLKISNTQLHRYLRSLLDLEYIYQSGGHSNRGFKYRVRYWDDNQKLRTEIRNDLTTQLAGL